MNDGLKEVRKTEPCICVVVSSPGQGKASVVAPRQEPGSTAGPVQSGGHWQGWNCRDGDKKRGPRSSRARGQERSGARLCGAH